MTGIELIAKESQEKIVIGCNYHTKWQRDKGMRFVLAEIKGDMARLYTRRTKRNFWTKISDLVFITTETNKSKAERLTKN